MRLLPREQDKLMLHYAGALAKERLARGVKLNYTEAVAYISAELMELARDGHSVTELMRMGRHMLTSGDVMDGVAEMIHEIQIEATFPDGTKLVTVHNPIETSGALVPGEIIVDEGEITINDGKQAVTLAVMNTADRPVQVGSHYHFFEVNGGLEFDRQAAYGMRLDIPSGTAVRFEPGETKTVSLIPIGGARRVFGLRDKVCGALDDEDVKNRAFEKIGEVK